MIKKVGEKIKNEAKEQKGWFLATLLDTLGASLLRNMSGTKGVLGAGKGTIRAVQDINIASYFY